MTWRRAARAIGLTVGAAAVLLACFASLATWWLHRPGPPLAAPVEVSIAEGAHLGEIASQLHARGLLDHALPFVVWARLSRRDRAVRSGDYIFPSALSPLDLLARITGRPDALHTVTIPEGLTVDEIVRLLEAGGFGSAESFHCLLDDPLFLASEDLPPQGAEGYLFPDTYALPLAMPQERILRTMIHRFRQVVGPELELRAADLGLSLHEAVTLASLIEEETARPEERPLVAAVYLNRLRRGMPLQADPTVLYGRAPGDRTISRADLHHATPYNTYTSRGLPPTPIANPGRAALEAAVAPAAVPYLYFVARGDGTHEFNTELGPHQAAVARWRRR